MPEPTISYLVARLDRILKARLDEALEGTGLTLVEFTALSIIASRPGLTNARLARRSLVTPQAMHRVMLSLEEAGYVARSSSPPGGRALGAEITDAGQSMIDHVMPAIASAESSILSDLPPAERTRLVDSLQALAQLEG